MLQGYFKLVDSFCLIHSNTLKRNFARSQNNEDNDIESFVILLPRQWRQLYSLFSILFLLIVNLQRHFKAIFWSNILNIKNILILSVIFFQSDCACLQKNRQSYHNSMVFLPKAAEIVTYYFFIWVLTYGLLNSRNSCGNKESQTF